MGRIVLGDDEGAAGLLVEPVNNPGPFMAADPGKIFAWASSAFTNVPRSFPAPG